MPTYLLRPSSVLQNGGGVSIQGGAPTALAALSDNSDVTYLTQSGSQPETRWRFGIPNPSVPTSQFVAMVGGTVRSRHFFAVSFVGARTLRQADTVDFIPAIGLQNTANWVDSETGRQNVDWLRADLASLQLVWNSLSGASTPHTSEVWGTIYTIVQSTAVPTATSMTTSSFPSIPVTVTSTVDWEAGQPESTNLRKVTVEVRIEDSGSAGPGLGTLISTASFDLQVTATGSVAITANMPQAIANGTYKVYTRARRYSQVTTPANAAEQYGAWSSAVTLTMNVPAPSTPTLAATVDNALDHITLAATPVSGNSYTSPLVTIQRSDDGGTTWQAVRGATRVPGSFGVATQVVDREAPRGVLVQYRAQVTASLGGAQNPSAWSTIATATITADLTWNIRVPQLPALDILGINIIGNPVEQIDEDLGVFRPIDRRYPVVVAGQLTGWDGDLTISTVTAAEWTAVAAILEAQLVLLLQSPFGGQKYIRIVGGAKAAQLGTPTTPQRRVTVSYVETQVP